MVRAAYGNHVKVFQTDIPNSIRAAEMSAEGKSIFLHDPRGKVADAYMRLTKEVLAGGKEKSKYQPQELR